MLEQDEWLDYIRNWRENEAVNDRTTWMHSATSCVVDHAVLPDSELREHVQRIPMVHPQVRRTTSDDVAPAAVRS